MTTRRRPMLGASLAAPLSLVAGSPGRAEDEPTEITTGDRIPRIGVRH